MKAKLFTILVLALFVAGTGCGKKGEEGKKDEARLLLEAIVAVPEAELIRSKVPDLKEEQATARKLLDKHF